MKLASFLYQGKRSYGIVQADGAAVWATATATLKRCCRATGWRRPPAT